MRTLILSLVGLALAQTNGGLPLVAGYDLSQLVGTTPFFEFAPVWGGGMTTPCKCSTVTGSKGETLVFSRSGGATCSKKGYATTGIQEQDIVECAPNIPIIMPDADGTMGIEVQQTARVNNLLRFIEINLSPWFDIGTPTLTTGLVSPWLAGPTSNRAVRITDDDGAAYEGRGQNVNVGFVGAATWFHCYAKADTATSIRLTLDNTSTTATLSPDSWTWVRVFDVTVSTNPTTAKIEVGNSAAVTGSIVLGGCQVEVNNSPGMMIPTTTAVGTRNADSAWYVVLPSGAPTATTNSIAASFTQTNTPALGGLITVGFLSGSDYTTEDAAYITTLTPTISVGCGVATGSPLTRYTSEPTGNPLTYRTWCAADGSTVTAVTNGNAGAASSAFPAGTKPMVRMMPNAQTGLVKQNGILSRVCFDPNPLRCR